MKTAQVDSLGDQAAQIMMRSALLFLRERGVVMSDGLLDRIVIELRAAAPAAIDEALRDAREAFEAGAAGVAGTTFAATMSLFGIRAATAAVEALAVQP